MKIITGERGSGKTHRLIEEVLAHDGNAVVIVSDLRVEEMVRRIRTLAGDEWGSKIRWGVGPFWDKKGVHGLYVTTRWSKDHGADWGVFVEGFEQFLESHDGPIDVSRIKAVTMRGRPEVIVTDFRVAQDFAVPDGAPVLAQEDGKVIYPDPLPDGVPLAYGAMADALEAQAKVARDLAQRWPVRQEGLPKGAPNMEPMP